MLDERLIVRVIGSGRARNSRSLCFRGARLTYRTPQNESALTEFDRLFETLHRRTGIKS